MQSSPRRGGRGPAPEPMPQRLLMPGEYRAPEGDELDERELAALAAERPLVRASAPGPSPEPPWRRRWPASRENWERHICPICRSCRPPAGRGPATARTWQSARESPLMVHPSAGAWCTAPDAVHANRLWPRTGCSRISIFWLTEWAHALRAAAPQRRPGEKGRPAPPTRSSSPVR